LIARRTSTLSNGGILALSSSQIENEAATESTATFGPLSETYSSGCRNWAMSTAPRSSSEIRAAEVGTSFMITVFM
jgi:hypothetical protein